MKVFLSIHSHPNPSHRNRIECILRMLEDCGAQTFCIARDIEKWGEIRFAPDELMRATLREIRNMHLVIVDLEEDSVGMGIEAGYAAARGITIFTIAPIGGYISPSLAGISSSVFQYASLTELEGYFQSLRSFLTS